MPCEHKRDRCYCVDCYLNETGGSFICQHLRRKDECKQCGGKRVQYITCDCGRKIQQQYMRKHLKLKIHERKLSAPKEGHKAAPRAPAQAVLQLLRNVVSLARPIRILIIFQL